MEKRAKHKTITISVIIIILLILTSLKLTGLATINDINNKIENTKYFGPAFYILILTIHGIFSFFPAAILLLFGGKYFGILNGFLYSMIGLTTGATAAFFIAKKYGRDIEEEWMSKKKIQHLTKIFKKWKNYIIILGRTIPIFPPDTISFLSGASGIKFKRFLPATILGLIPTTLLLVYLGTRITLDTKIIIGIILLAIAITIFHKSIYKIIKKIATNTK